MIDISSITSFRYAIMAYCWAASARKRPSAPQLYRELHQFHQQLNEYIWKIFLMRIKTYFNESF